MNDIAVSDQQSAVSEQTTDGSDVSIPIIPHYLITDDVMRKSEALMHSISLHKSISVGEKEIEHHYGVNARTQQRWKIALRKLFKLPSRSSLSILISHPQIRQAVEYIVVRKEPSDKGTLRSAKRIVVVVGTHGEYASAEEFLLSMYSRPNADAVSAFTALSNQCVTGKAFTADESDKLSPCKESDLPLLPSVQRWLRRKAKANLAVRWAKMTRSERDTYNIYVKRNPQEYRVRGYLEADHTELDVQVINSKTGGYGRLWVSSCVDFHSSLGCGFYLTYHPDSASVALAARNAFLGTQLKVAVPDENGGVAYKALENFIDIADDIEIDNGKAYKSRYTGQIFGKVDFTDDARRTIQRFTTIHHAQKQHPQSKPHVEKDFDVLNNYWKHLPGYKGPQYRRKPEALRDEEKQNLIMFDWQYAQLFELAWQARNNRSMRRLGGLSRIQYVLEHQQNRRVISDERIFDLLLLKPPTERTIRRGYITMKGINGAEYFSADLKEFNGEKCTVYYDPQNIGYAHIYMHGKPVTVAVNTELIGKTQREWLEVVKMRKAQDKGLDEEIKVLHKHISDIEAKAFAWNGAIGNVRFVAGELMNKRSAEVNLLTGLEEHVKEVASQKQQAELISEIERDAKKRAKGMHLTLALVNDRIR